jgi:hypothetical protein
VDVEVVGVGDDWVQYKCAYPNDINPMVIEQLVANKSKVLTLREIPRSLEKVYLQAVAEEGNHVE